MGAVLSSDGCPRPPPAAWSLEACTWRLPKGEEYRTLQELAYANHEGASASSVYGLMCLYPLVVCLQHLVSAACPLTNGLPRMFVLEVLVPMLPLTICFAAPQHWAWHLLVLATACLALLPWRPRGTTAAEGKAAGSPTFFTTIDQEGMRLRFVAEYRAVIMITTCLAILAVDFPSLFARSQAKTEEYGFSLMDLGTGCIVCSTAVCSRAARAHDPKKGGAGRGLLQRLLALWPVLALGFSRLYVLRGIDYHVPTSEYGVHWNFFFTITVVALASEAANLGAWHCPVAGALLLGGYQLYLSHAGGAEYLLYAPRRDLFSANRDGILSSLGFLSLHWLSVGLGAALRNPQTSAVRVVARLLAVSAGCAMATWLLTLWGSVAPSRRMCNLPYVLLVLSISALVLGSLALLDLLWPRPRPPLCLAYGGVQDSMLIVFLLANLLTGAVNLCVHSLLVPPGGALAILVLYSLAWSVPFAILRARGWALKFW